MLVPTSMGGPGLQRPPPGGAAHQPSSRLWAISEHQLRLSPFGHCSAAYCERFDQRRPVQAFPSSLTCDVTHCQRTCRLSSDIVHPLVGQPLWSRCAALAILVWTHGLAGSSAAFSVPAAPPGTESGGLPNSSVSATEIWLGCREAVAQDQGLPRC
jgi:hypothetical protein